MSTKHEPRCLWRCDNGTYDICEPDGVVFQNVPVQLLAAAPDLLSAVEYLLPIAEKNAETSFGKDTIRMARSAIAKAKGE